jgi:probable rRNA maturation factor
MPSPRLRTHLSLQTPDTRPPLRGWLARQFRAAATALGVTAGEITLAIVDDARMSEVHRRHLGIAGPTDVITFDLRDSPAAPVEGDLVVCLDEARRQASARGHEARLEVLLYAVHGLLHLLGYDDHRPRDAARMHAQEGKTLQQLGLRDVFAAPEQSGKSRRKPPRPSRGRSKPLK